MPWHEIILRIGLALLTGAAVGLNRDLFGKPTGIRLHALVAVGSAAAVMCGLESDATGASRVIQGIVGGIGFLGAGVIMRGATPGPPARVPGTPQLLAPDHPVAHDTVSPAASLQDSREEARRAPDIHYLTTAASIWLTAALGIVAGLGLWKLLVTVTLATNIILLLGVPVDRGLFGRFARRQRPPRAPYE